MLLCSVAHERFRRTDTPAVVCVSQHHVPWTVGERRGTQLHNTTTHYSTDDAKSRNAVCQRERSGVSRRVMGVRRTHLHTSHTKHRLQGLGQCRGTCIADLVAAQLQKCDRAIRLVILPAVIATPSAGHAACMLFMTMALEHACAADGVFLATAIPLHVLWRYMVSGGVLCDSSLQPKTVPCRATS